MKPFHLLPLLLSLWLVPGRNIGQQKFQGCYGFDCRQRNWVVSFSSGNVFFSPAGQLVRAMQRSGFGESNIRFPSAADPGGVSIYPVRRSLSNWEIGIQRRFNAHTRIAINLGQSWGQDITGNDQQESYDLDQMPWGNTLELVCRAWTLSGQYIRRANTKMENSFSVGPAVVFHEVKEINAGNDPYRHLAVRPGIHLGYMHGFVKSKRWVFGLKAEYKRFLNDK
ncbi:MAG TPA: hypothetical protein VJ508_14525, partial [Saprospiraceae bacterium]|nr:hypothetical protein [Saprospiraceae bacterium]